MRTFQDAYAGWTFKTNFLNSYSNPLSELTLEEYYELLKKMLSVFLLVLDRLEEFKIFRPKKLLLGNDYESFYKETLINQIIDLSIKKNSWIVHFSLEGDTTIYEKGISKEYQNIINIQYELFIDLISIETYSDIWMPFDNELSDLDVNRAKINSLRLEACLMSIKDLNLFREIEPKENQLFKGYSVIQQGFRMYYPLSMLKFFDNKTQNQVRDFILE